MRAASTFFVLLAIAGCARENASLPVGPANSMRLEIYKSHDSKRPAASSEVTEPGSVNCVLDVLRQGVRQTDHKCAGAGKAAFAFLDGQTVTLEILPGHDPANYEFRHDRHNYRVPRDALLAAFEKAGVDMTAIPKD